MAESRTAHTPMIPKTARRNLQMPESLFIEEESYYGFLSRKLQIPSEQVWLFYRSHTPPIIVWGSENTKIPRVPLLTRTAIQIYKFYYSTTFSSSIILFDSSRS